MKIKVLVKQEVEISVLSVKAGVRYWEDATVNGVEDEEGKLIPFRDGDYWCPIIDINSGKILNWPKGTKADIHYKVCDDGTYTLISPEGKEVIEKDGYVPEIMCPKEQGYGDYIIMDIDENGQIQNWKPFVKDFNEDQD